MPWRVAARRLAVASVALSRVIPKPAVARSAVSMLTVSMLTVSILAVSMLAASCSSVDQGSLAGASPGSSLDIGFAEGLDGAAGAAAPPEPLSDTTLPPSRPRGDAKALVTPTGLIVPIVGQDPAGFRVTTPCGAEALVSWGTPLYAADIVLDPGHGGDVETGAEGPNGLVEKDLNLDVAERTARELEDRGYLVVLTRTRDYRLPLEVRAAIANRLDARALVSIHHNAPTPRPSARPGTEVFTQTGSSESGRLGGLIWEEVVEALSGFPDIAWAAADDAGALRVTNRDGEDSYGMVRRPEMPAVLAELGYLSNAPEAELFATPEYIEVVSVALADAVERWLESDDIGSGLQARPRLFSPDGRTGHSRGCVDPPLE